jgi:hypothetical protein
MSQLDTMNMHKEYKMMTGLDIKEYDTDTCTNMLHIHEVLASNVNPHTVCIFHQPCHANAGIVHEIRPQVLPSRSFPIL